MSTFPKLKTDAVSQYPAQRTTGFSTTILQFVGGAEQRFRNYGLPLRSWKIDLRLLDDSEMNKVETFYTAQEGQFNSFSFTDPWDQTTYPSCSLEIPELAMQYIGPQSGALHLIVRENRG